jgi:hypothetical protein
MSGIKLFQNAGSVQEIVHQRIDRDHLTARLKPVEVGSLGLPSRPRTTSL